MALLSRRRTMRAHYPQGKALVAAASRTTPAENERYRRLSQQWQRDAFATYHSLGECWYPAQFYAKAMSKLRIFAAVKDDQGEVEELKAETWAAQELARIQDPGGGTEQLFFSYGRLWFLTGEAWLLGQKDEEDAQEESWEFLSSSELRAIPGGKGYARYSWPGAQPEEIADAPDDDYEPLPGFAVVYRFHNPDPEYSSLADGPIRAVLPLYQQIALLEATFTARLKSRLASVGILLVADNIDFGAPDGENTDNPKTDPFGRMLQEAMLRPIRDPQSASAVAPIVLRAPPDMIANDEVMKLIRIHDPNETIPELEQWSKAVERLSLGLDMPPEILLGMTDANHWTAWQIDDQTWTAHLQPIAETLCANLGAAFLRPAARKAGQANADDLVVGYDAAEIINHPNRVQDAKDLHDRLVIGDETLRTVAGFGDDDAPTSEETARGLLIKLRGPSALQALQDIGGLPDLQTPPTEAQQQLPPSEELAQQQQEGQESAMSASVGRVIGAADMAVERARERAGAKIIRKISSANCEDCAQRAQTVRHALVASAVGQEATTGMGLTVPVLVAGTGDHLRPVLERQGIPSPVARRIASYVETYAGKTLYMEDATLPDEFAGVIASVLGNGAS